MNDPIDISKLSRKERRDLLAKTITVTNYKIRKLKKINRVLAKYQNDVEVMELIRHGKHKDEELNDLWRTAKSLIRDCAEARELIPKLTNGTNRPRDTDKKSA